MEDAGEAPGNIDCGGGVEVDDGEGKGLEERGVVEDGGGVAAMETTEIVGCAGASYGLFDVDT